MDGLAVLKGNYTQDARCGLVWQGDLAPVADPVVGLHFTADWVSYDGSAEFDGQVRALAHDLFIEIAGDQHQR